MSVGTAVAAPRIKPFFCYYGGKWRAAPRYPAPMYSTIIEPFAGAAGYACRYPDREVHLYDVDPVIAGLWRYLIDVSEDEIRSLPLDVTHVDDLDVSAGAKWLIGFWLNKGGNGPCKQPSRWMRDGTNANSFWGPTIRDRIASQVNSIRHWTISCASYVDIPQQTATWFVDPPYNNKAGRRYRFGKDLDYPSLGEWCISRDGQVIVCEQDGSEWLPFQFFGNSRSAPGIRRKNYSAEAIWTSGDMW